MGIDLDPDYQAAEEMLSVRPVDPERMGRNGRLREGAEALGVRHAPCTETPRLHQCSSCRPAAGLMQTRHARLYLPRAVARG
jgi:hypothetical protein